jgi:hypothetical protein
MPGPLQSSPGAQAAHAVAASESWSMLPDAQGVDAVRPGALQSVPGGHAPEAQLPPVPAVPGAHGTQVENGSDPDPGSKPSSHWQVSGVLVPATKWASAAHGVHTRFWFGAQAVVSASQPATQSRPHVAQLTHADSGLWSSSWCSAAHLRISILTQTLGRPQVGTAG